MNDKQQILKSGLRYGLVGGGIAIAIFLVFYFLKADPIGSIRFFDFVLIPIFVFFAIKELRDYRLGGRMAYWQGMSVGFVVYGLIALMSALFIYVFLAWVSPETFGTYQQENLKVLTEEPQKWIDEIGKEPYEKAVDDMSRLSVGEVAVDDLLKKLVIGLFLTSFISIFLKRNPNGN